MSKLNSKLYSAPLDQAGKEIQFDVREDEEQQKKLQETLELLVAAGYFRARIKGLSAFDKVVGGMTWCITTCNFDVDVDLLFQESSTIGQKIALTERIVAVLPRMKCPHAIEPHQIQGFDFKNIYPVIQWLVKKAIETRAEMGDMNRSFALSLFSKMDCEKPNEQEEAKLHTALKSIENLKDQNAPQRKYKRDYNKVSDRLVKIQSTLLEYGQQNILLSSLLTQQQNQQQASNQKQTQEQQKQQQQQANNAVIEEEKNIKRLINEMSETDQKQNKVAATTVGQILGLQQTALKQIVDEFTNKDNQLQQEIDQLEKLAASGADSLGGLQHKQRIINILSKQIEQKQSDLDEKKIEINKLNETVESAKQNYTNLKTIEQNLNEKLAQLVEYEKNVDKKSVDKLQQLVQINDELKQKEQDYKKKCKEELKQLEDELEKLKNRELSSDAADENEKFENINEQYEATKAKLNALRLKNAKKNREISVLKRKLDEIPSRIELTQYQKRFIELYNQMSSVHTQTKQFYIFYNVLEDKKLFMNKEINLLNSVHDQFNQAMSTVSTREQFVKQLELILEGIKQNLTKIENKKSDVKSKCDQLNDKYISLIEKKRVYYKTLRDFQDECKRNLELVS